MTAVGSVMGLVVGGALTEVSWRLAFLVNVPIGLVMMYLARTALRETNRERMKLDATGAVLATLACTAAVFAFSMGPEKGWISLTTISSGVVALGAALAFVIVERTAKTRWCRSTCSATATGWSPSSRSSWPAASCSP